MENRYKLQKDVQMVFFRAIESSSGLHSNQLASIFSVVPRSYRDWRRGKYAIPESVVDIVEKRFHVFFPDSKEAARNLWEQSKINASRKGAFAMIKKYGAPGTPEGRSKGGKKGIKTLRERGLIPQPKPFYSPQEYSEELAEFVGILLGDGHIGNEQWSITVSAKVDNKYSHFIVQLIQHLFRFNPYYKIRDDSNVILISGSSIGAIQYLTSIGLRPGNKIKLQVDVPQWIKENPTYRIACLRGLVDTDGGIFKHAYSVNGKSYTYTKLSFVNRSIPLLQFALDTLRSLQFNPKIIDKVANKRVWLYNQTEVKRYITLVGTHNPRLLKNLDSYKGGVR
ncbi:hypothetical protein HY409_01615 [Candidatus Gottesmanbacteria bacterium]|nr:hypothetical protein [Candidatus Gottesmanbacteria bacterium]